MSKLSKATMTAFLSLSVMAVTAAPGFAAGDADAGKKVFRKCKACHVIDGPKHRVGPSLQNVLGRTAGTAEGYKYSKAMVAYGEGGVVWNVETLLQFLEAPRKVVPGTKMSFAGLKKPGDRENVIAYIEQASQ